MSKSRESSIGCAAHGAAASLVLALLLAAPAGAQVYSTPYSHSDSQRRGGQNSSGGHDFPSWEHDVGVQDGQPLPEGPPGQYLPLVAVDVGGTPLGAAALLGGLFAIDMAEGGVKFLDATGKVVGDVRTAPCTQPPIAFERSAIVASGAVVSRVSAGGVIWTREASASLAFPPVAGVAEIACGTTDGRLELFDASTGATRWTTHLDAPPVGLRLLRTVAVVATADGTVMGLDVTYGAELWRTSVGEAAYSLVADETAAWIGGRGPSDRTKLIADVIARIPLAEGGRRIGGGRDWRLRVGGNCAASPMLLDDVVAFACHDGYIHAIDRTKGVGGWRTDLPARSWNAPALAGGRLDFVLHRTRFVVAIAADNGAVLGWSQLEDPDEVFVGPAAWGSNVTVATTSLGRVLFLGWQYDAPQSDDSENGPALEPFGYPGVQ